VEFENIRGRWHTKKKGLRRKNTEKKTLQPRTHFCRKRGELGLTTDRQSTPGEKRMGRVKKGLPKSGGSENKESLCSKPQKKRRKDLSGRPKNEPFLKTPSASSQEKRHIGQSGTNHGGKEMAAVGCKNEGRQLSKMGVLLVEKSGCGDTKKALLRKKTQVNGRTRDVGGSTRRETQGGGEVRSELH